jgi:hypothetical protein
MFYPGERVWFLNTQYTPPAVCEANVQAQHGDLVLLFVVDPDPREDPEAEKFTNRPGWMFHHDIVRFRGVMRCQHDNVHRSREDAMRSAILQLLTDR